MCAWFLRRGLGLALEYVWGPGRRGHADCAHGCRRGMGDRRILVAGSAHNLVPFPCIPWKIQGNNVDYVVEVDSIADPAKIVSGSTQITRSPDRLRIAEFIARFLRDAGIMRNGFPSRQARVESLWRSSAISSR